MIYGKLNCDISVPPTYYRKMWEYDYSNVFPGGGGGGGGGDVN